MDAQTKRILRFFAPHTMAAVGSIFMTVWVGSMLIALGMDVRRCVRRWIAIREIVATAEQLQKDQQAYFAEHGQYHWVEEPPWPDEWECQVSGSVYTREPGQRYSGKLPEGMPMPDTSAPTYMGQVIAFCSWNLGPVMSVRFSSHDDRIWDDDESPRALWGSFRPVVEEEPLVVFR